MIEFDDLTPVGQARRLRVLASKALEQYGTTVRRMQLLAASFNTLYRVATPDGTLVLRVGPRERIHPAHAAAAEAAWTDRLAAAGALVPRVLRASDGSPSVTVTADDVPGARECTLLTWQPGRPVSRPVSLSVVAELAALSAQLHTLSPDEPARPTGALDGRPALLFEIPDRLDEVAARHRDLFRDACTRAQAAVDALWAGASRPPRLVHGDLTANNVVRSSRGLAAVDFQDMTWGMEHQDLANTLFGLARDDPDGRLARAFRAEYESHRPWPGQPDLDDALLADLFIARRLQMVNLALSLKRPGLDEYIERHARALRDYRQSA